MITTNNLNTKNNKETNTPNEQPGSENYLSNYIENSKKRLDEIEAKLAVIDTVLAALLPEGTRVLTNSDGVEVLYVPLKKKE